MVPQRSTTYITKATYILRVVVSPEQLELELEDKFAGDIWHAAYSSLAIE